MGTPRMLEDLETPVVLVDEDTLEHNLRAMAERLAARGLALCPHTKTHKSPVLAQRQMAWGAARVMAAKLSEAEALLDYGIRDQFIGYPLVGAAKAEHLARLVQAGLLPAVAVDSKAGVDLLSAVARRLDVPIAALVEVDTGFHRCGLSQEADIVELARYIQMSPVAYQGITCFGGHISWRQPVKDIPGLVRAEDEMLDRIAAALARADLAPTVISEGGTVIAGYLQELRTATELRPGIYVFNDVGTVMAGAARYDDCAARVLTTVVSTPAADRAVVDAGSKTLAGDGPIAGSYGYVAERPDLAVVQLTEEHGVVVRREGGAVGLSLGQRLTIIPNHVCTMINLHETVQLVRGSVVTGQLPIVMRGAVR